MMEVVEDMVNHHGTILAEESAGDLVQLNDTLAAETPLDTSHSPEVKEKKSASVVERPTARCSEEAMDFSIGFGAEESGWRMRCLLSKVWVDHCCPF